MSLIIPEFKIHEIYTNILNYIKADLDSNSGDETKSMLYRMFGGITFENFNYYDQIKKVVNDYAATAKGKRKLKITIGHDFNNNQYPSMAIILPAEQDNPLKQLFGRRGRHNRKRQFINATESSQLRN